MNGGRPQPWPSGLKSSGGAPTLTPGRAGPATARRRRRRGRRRWRGPGRAGPRGRRRRAAARRGAAGPRRGRRHALRPLEGGQPRRRATRVAQRLGPRAASGRPCTSARAQNAAQPSSDAPWAARKPREYQRWSARGPGRRHARGPRASAPTPGRGRRRAPRGGRRACPLERARLRDVQRGEVDRSGAGCASVGSTASTGSTARGRPAWERAAGSARRPGRLGRPPSERAVATSPRSPMPTARWSGSWAPASSTPHSRRSGGQVAPAGADDEGASRVASSSGRRSWIAEREGRREARRRSPASCRPRAASLARVEQDRRWSPGRSDPDGSRSGGPAGSPIASRRRIVRWRRGGVPGAPACRVQPSSMPQAVGATVPLAWSAGHELPAGRRPPTAVARALERRHAVATMRSARSGFGATMTWAPASASSAGLDRPPEIGRYWMRTSPLSSIATCTGLVRSPVDGTGRSESARLVGPEVGGSEVYSIGRSSSRTWTR